MTEASGEPPDGEALWGFSLAFYARSGVSEALIALQDRVGCDVNLMLFALWLGVSGRSGLTSDGLAAADLIVRPITADIVEPLRTLRRKLKSDRDVDVQSLREEVKRLELRAERIVQHRLAGIAGPRSGEVDPAARMATAHANFVLYLGPEMAHSAEARTILEALGAFVRG